MIEFLSHPDLALTTIPQSMHLVDNAMLFQYKDLDSFVLSHAAKSYVCDRVGSPGG